MEELRKNRYLFEIISPECHPKAKVNLGGHAITAETFKAYCSVCGKEATVVPLASPEDGSYPVYFEAVVDLDKREMLIYTHVRKGAYGIN